MTPLAEIRTPLLQEKSDEQLVELTRLGNPVAFETLFRRYSPRLVRFSEHMLGPNRSSAEDIVQEVMTAARQAIAGAQRPENVRPWLYQATRNRCLNYLRDESALKRPQIDNGRELDGLDQLERIASRVPSAHEQAERRAEIRQLVDDLRALPETQRTALILRELDGLGYEQMADVLQTTIPSVKSLLVRARLGLADIAAGRALDCEVVRVALARSEQRLGGLSPAERAHLKHCDECDELRGRLRATSRSLAALSPIGLSFSLKGALAATLGGGGAAGTAVAGKAAAGAGAAGAAAGAASVAGAGGAGSVVAGGLFAGGAGLFAKGLIATVAASLVAAGSVYLPQRGGSVEDAAAPDAVSALPAGAAGAAAEPSGGGSDDPKAGAPADDKPQVVTIAGDESAPEGTGAATVSIEEPATDEAGTDTGERGRSAPGDDSSGPRGRRVPDGAPTLPPAVPPPAEPAPEEPVDTAPEGTSGGTAAPGATTTSESSGT